MKQGAAWAPGRCVGWPVSGDEVQSAPGGGTGSESFGVAGGGGARFMGQGEAGNGVGAGALRGEAGVAG